MGLDRALDGGELSCAESVGMGGFPSCSSLINIHVQYLHV